MTRCPCGYPVCKCADCMRRHCLTWVDKLQGDLWWYSGAIFTLVTVGVGLLGYYPPERSWPLSPGYLLLGAAGGLLPLWFGWRSLLTRYQAVLLCLPPFPPSHR